MQSSPPLGSMKVGLSVGLSVARGEAARGRLIFHLACNRSPSPPLLPPTIFPTDSKMNEAITEAADALGLVDECSSLKRLKDKSNRVAEELGLRMRA
mmetsp:Transcript_8187/g.21049  ORF Transcript_8187/g.21049 Transcript_8187/m.21049 type:complete len:97 (-) Transcript_8187:57-347(-)